MQVSSRSEFDTYPWEHTLALLPVPLSVRNLFPSTAGLTGHWSTKPAWSVRRISTYGVANMRVVNETTLEWSFVVDLNGTIADSFTLYKDITC